ncbi:MAG: P-loop NTPase [Spirochaetales bacterium]|nr:P-loop NTPase [Spirochaetales bacterium]
MHIIPIASGKGGVGKSLVAANLSIALAQTGRKVVIVDLDLGGSNLHVILGQMGSLKGIGTYMTADDVSFEDIILDTSYKNLRFIAGEAEVPGMANLKVTQKKKIINNLLKLDADYLIIDLGAGTSIDIMDFFLMSGRGLIVTSPTLTANLNAYLFLKNISFRLLNNCFPAKSPGGQYLTKLKKDGHSLQKVYIPKLVDQLYKIDPENSNKYNDIIKSLRPRLILNLMEEPKDAAKATKLRHSSREYLGLDLEHLGVIYRDDIQIKALNSRLPVIKYKPGAIISQAIFRIADKLIEEEDTVDDPLLNIDLDNSFKEAELEAETDFESRMEYLNDLLYTDNFSVSDLIETVKSQQYEISQLKKENNLLKTKLVNAVKSGFIV